VYPWIWYSVFILIIIEHHYEPLSWIFNFDTSNIIIRSAIFGVAGFGAIIHIILAVKMKKLVHINTRIENIVFLSLAPIPILILTQNDNYLDAIFKVFFPSLLWYSFMNFINITPSDKLDKKDKIKIVTLMSCLISSGVYYSISMNQELILVLTLFMAGILSILLLKQDKLEKVAKILFGISQSYRFSTFEKSRKKLE